ncbi:MAG: c-type cytochrome [Acidobacteria bacterium]|nr:c-type cytochrome [Acidobacteriota bacterium]
MRWSSLLLGCALAAAESPEALFTSHCAGCHGPKGNGGKGANLAVPRLMRASTDEALFNVIAYGIAGTEMPASRMTDEEAWVLVGYVRSLGRVAPQAGPGDALRGEKLYRRENCEMCHTIRGYGGPIGPDLTEIGARRSAAYLRTSLVDPEAAIPDNFVFYRRIIFLPDNFLQVRIVTQDGRRITGVRLNEDPFSIQIRDYSSQFHSFLKSELKELHKDWGKSPMSSYAKIYSREELDDVVAYLVSLRGDR